MARIRKQLSENYNKNWKVAFYIRLSKEDGNDVSLSVEHQKEILENYLNNSEENLELVGVYIDDGKTGTDSDRPEFQRMLHDIELKKVNCVIVKDTSRLSRNYAEAGLYMEQVFFEKGVRFISLHLPTLDSYKNPDEISSIATAMQNVINDDFCRQTSLKIRGVFNVKRNKGQFIGAFAPYGYLKHPENKYQLIIDNDTADIIKNIFKWFMDGLPKTTIAKRLNDLGIPNPSTHKKNIGLNYNNPHQKFNSSLWTMRTIDNILRNQMYVGDMVQGRGKIISYKIHKQVAVPEDEWFIVPNTHEPIISREDFNKVQELLKRDMKKATNADITYLFSGLLKCADCKKSMHRQKTGQYVYYSCKTYKQLSKTTCTKHSIREDELTKAVLVSINAQLSLIEDIKKVIQQIEKAPTTKSIINRIIKGIKTTETDLEKTNRIRDNLYLDMQNGIITRDDYFRLRKSQDEKVSTLTNILLSLKKELEVIQSGLKVDNPYFQHFKKYTSLEQLERGLLIDLIDTIYIGENKQIIIDYKFADQQKQILSLIEEKDKDKIKRFVL